MNYEAAILYAIQQMEKIGLKPDQYHYEPVYVSASREDAHVGSFEITAYNELYILVHPEKYYGVFILSDNTAFNSDEPLETGAPDHTGVIRFKRIAPNWNFERIGSDGTPLPPLPIEFLRVVY